MARSSSAPASTSQRVRCVPMRVEQLPQKRHELVGHVWSLLAELPEKNSDVALVDAEVRGQILAARRDVT